MDTKYIKLINNISISDWSHDSISTNINGYPKYIFTKENNNQKLDIEIEPYDGYDSGEPKGDLEFYVNVYTYNTYDESTNEWIDSELKNSKRFKDVDVAVDYLIDKLKDSANL